MAFRLPPWWPHAAMGLQTLLVAPGYTFGKYAAQALPPLALMQIRIGGAAVIFLLMLLVFRPRSFITFRIPRKELLKILPLVIISPISNQLFFVAGLRYASPAAAALMFSLIPLVVLLIGVFVLRVERLTRNKVLGIGLAIAGVYFVVSATSGVPRAGDDPMLGNLLIFGSMFCWALFILFNKRFMALYPPIEFMATMMVMGCIVFMPIGIPALFEVDFAAVPTEAWLGLGWLTVFNSAASFMLLSLALRELQSSQVSVYTNLQPGFAALVSAAMGFDALNGMLGLGVLFAFLGVLMLNRKLPLFGNR